MRRRWLRAAGSPPALAAFTVAIHLFGFVAFHRLYLAAFGGARRIPEAFDVPLALGILAATGLLAGGCAALGAYRVLCARALALPWLLVFAPSLLAAATWLLAVPIVLQWV